MSLATRARWAIDRNLRRDLSTRQRGEACGCLALSSRPRFWCDNGNVGDGDARARRLSAAARTSPLAPPTSSISRSSSVMRATRHSRAPSRHSSARRPKRYGATRRRWTFPVQPAKLRDEAPMPLNMVRSEKTGELYFIGLSEHVPLNDEPHHPGDGAASCRATRDRGSALTLYRGASAPMSTDTAISIMSAPSR
jgi:hypothetical protein